MVAQPPQVDLGRESPRPPARSTAPRLLNDGLSSKGLVGSFPVSALPIRKHVVRFAIAAQEFQHAAWCPWRGRQRHYAGAEMAWTMRSEARDAGYTFPILL